METTSTMRKALLGRLLSTANERELRVTGNQDLGWILIRQVKLGQDFNRPESSVNIRFGQYRGDPNIAIFATVELRGDSKACPHFLQQTGPADAWRPLCPHIFQDVGDDILEFIACLMGLLAEPCLCGLLGCEWKEGVQANQGIMQNSGNYSSTKASDMPAVE